MLNRNDRVALRRNRAAVSWLCFILFIFIIWIVNLYKDKSHINDEAEINLSQMTEYQNVIISKNKTIDSLNSVILKFTQVKKDTIEIKQVRQLPKVKESKKDSSFVKLNPDTIKKDTIK